MKMGISMDAKTFAAIKEINIKLSALDTNVAVLAEHSKNNDEIIKGILASFNQCRSNEQAELNKIRDQQENLDKDYSEFKGKLWIVLIGIPIFISGVIGFLVTKLFK